MDVSSTKRVILYVLALGLVISRIIAAMDSGLIPYPSTFVRRLFISWSNSVSNNPMKVSSRKHMMNATAPKSEVYKHTYDQRTTYEF